MLHFELEDQFVGPEHNKVGGYLCDVIDGLRIGNDLLRQWMDHVKVGQILLFIANHCG